MNLFRTTIILAVLVLIEYYSFILVKTILRSLNSNTRGYIIALYIVFNILFWLSLYIIRTQLYIIPKSVQSIYIAFAFGFMVSKILFAVVLLGDDVRRSAIWVISKINHPSEITATNTNNISRSMFFSQFAVLLGIGTISGFIYGVANKYRYQVRKKKIKFSKLPQSFNNLKIVQISDIHCGSFDNPHAVSRGIKMILDLEPDVIFFTGDLVNYKTSEVTEEYKQIFSQLKAPMGVYSTLGNHDYGDYVSWPSAEAKKDNLEQIKKLHADMGWKLLMNEHIIFNKGNEQIALLGVENWGSKAHFPKYGKLNDAYMGLAEKNIPFKMLLSHDPSHWASQVLTSYKDIDLTFSGHTHGMQFGIDSKVFKWSPIKYVYKYWAGLYEVKNQNLY